MLLCVEDSGLMHRMPYNNRPLTPVMGHQCPKTAVARPQLAALQNGNVVAFSTGSQVTLLHGPSLARGKEVLRGGPLINNHLVNLMTIGGNAASKHLCILGLASGCYVDLIRVREDIFTSSTGRSWRQRLVPQPNVVMRSICLHVCERELLHDDNWSFHLFVEFVDGKLMCLLVTPCGVQILWQNSAPIHEIPVSLHSVSKQLSYFHTLDALVSIRRNEHGQIDMYTIACGLAMHDAVQLPSERCPPRRSRVFQPAAASYEDVCTIKAGCGHSDLSNEHMLLAASDSCDAHQDHNVWAFGYMKRRITIALMDASKDQTLIMCVDPAQFVAGSNSLNGDTVVWVQRAMVLPQKGQTTVCDITTDVSVGSGGRVLALLSGNHFACMCCPALGLNDNAGYWLQGFFLEDGTVAIPPMKIGWNLQASIYQPRLFAYNADGLADCGASNGLVLPGCVAHARWVQQMTQHNSSSLTEREADSDEEALMLWGDTVQSCIADAANVDTSAALTPGTPLLDCSLESNYDFEA